MAYGPRVLWQNYAALGLTTIAASSYDPASPPRRLRDQLRSNRWRSASGWTVVAGFNDSIDFSIANYNLTATIAPGTYATATLYAAAVVAALTAAYPGPGTWAVTYAANKFTVSFSVTEAGGLFPPFQGVMGGMGGMGAGMGVPALDAGAGFVLKWSTGAHAAASAGRDMGFSTTADTAIALSVTASGVAYQSRHYVTFSLPSILGVRAFVAFDHNSLTGGTYTANAATTLAAVLTAPAFTAAMAEAGYLDLRRAYLVAQGAADLSYQYWALIVDDVANPDGFVQVGIAYIGSWFEIDYIGRGLSRDRVDYSSVTYTAQGASFQDRKQTTKAWVVSFEAQSLAQVDTFDSTYDNVMVGGSFFFVPTDPSGEWSPTRILYCHMTAVPTVKQRTDSADLWDVTWSMQESLG